ncbi:uncharacterized protein JCM10292_007612 [Rhodotorula paludigena]|uniref:uncharacterized protein n=1 Tax=Rhodotorula paludigena TaxID=86838 RepID=UPI003172B357
MALRYDSCGTAGLASRSPNDAHRIVFRVQPASTTSTSTSLPDNTVLPQSLHPTLSAEHPLLFDGKARPLRVDSANASTCVDPISHTLPVLPRGVSNVAKAPELFFSVCTTPQRAETYARIWQHFMAPKGGDAFRRDEEKPPSVAGCLVTDAQGQGDTAGHARANAEFSKQGLSCRMQDSSRVGRRYEERVLGLIRDAWAESERRKWQEGATPVEWFVFHDDDTWFTDPDLLKDLLAEYDSRDDHFLGAFSESIGNYDMFGRISYGGAGMILSRALVRKMQPLVDQCAERFGHIFGGDGLVSNCAALARNGPLEQVVEEIPAMRQMDMQGDASGYLTAGTAPFLTLHHWTGWLELIPGIDGVAAIDLFRSTVNAVGGRNFLRRWVFDEGRVTWTVGHSIIVHRHALTPDALGRAEWTWQGHPSRQPSRPSLQEGEEKLTYLLTDVERLSANVARLRHTCSHPSVQDGLREIDVLWDMRDPQAWWRARLPSGWKDVFPSSPRAGLQALTGGSLWRTDAELDEDDEAEDQIEMQPVPARKRRIEYTA